MKKTAMAAGFLIGLVPLSVALADTTENRDTESFTRVEISGLMDVEIVAGEAQSISIKANNEEQLENITTRVRGDTLIIDMEEDRNFFSIFRDSDVEVHITVPMLNGVEMDGMGNLSIRNVDSDDFELGLDGLGSVTIDGTCRKARMVLDGMGDLKARGFECESVRLVLDGMGDAQIYASEYVDVNLDGFGNVDVYGDPEDSDVRRDGMGEVDFH